MLFDDIDLSKLKLPIEPQNLIYIYLAYKLINNLDKIQIGGNFPSPTRMPMPQFRRPQQINGFYSLFMFLILLTFGFVIMSNLINRISISSGTIEPIDIALKCSEAIRPINPNMMNKCPFLPNLSKDDYKDLLKKCPIYDSKKNVDNLSEESESKSKVVNI